MATATLPDDGIPVLTDVVESGAVAPLAALGRPDAAPAPQSDPLFKTMPLAILESASMAEVEAIDCPPSVAGPASVSAPPSVGGIPSVPGPASIPPGPAAPPISGPPSLSEFPPLPGSLPPISIDDLTERVHAAVLRGLLARVEPMVEARLKETLADLLEHVLADMTAELKVSARDIVRDAVARGVVDEVDALRARIRPLP